MDIAVPSKKELRLKGMRKGDDVFFGAWNFVNEQRGAGDHL